MGPIDRSSDAHDAGHHLAEILLDALLDLRRPRIQVRKHAGDIAAITLQQIARIGRLKLANGLRIQIVEPHADERVIHRPKGLDTGNTHQVQTVLRRDGRWIDSGIDDAPLFNGIEVSSVRASHEALLALHFVPTARLRANGERVADRRVVRAEIDTNPEVIGMSARSSADFADTSSITKRVVERIANRVGDETQSVQEVALARTVGADQERKLCRRDVARSNALVVAQCHTGHQTMISVHTSP